MTKTEERLTEALAARAAVVREDSLRPLTARAEAPRRAGARWLRKLVPLTAAVGLATAVILVIEAGHLVHQRPSAPFADVASAHAPPPYYVDLDWNHILTVRATSTGLLTDRLPPPDVWAGASARLETAVAAAANGRTFVVIYNDRGDGTGPYRTAIYTFTLTSAGHIADFNPVKDGVLSGLARISAAVSPDGSKVAIAGVPEAAAEGNGQPLQPARIVVVNLRTGRRGIFQGGMGRRGQQFGIGNVSWADDGRSLAYLAQWCPELDVQFTASCDVGTGVTQLRMISAASDGGPLSSGHVLLRESRLLPSVLAALITPDGASVVALTTRGREISVVRVAPGTGRPIIMVYRKRLIHALMAAFLASDGTGQYLIIDENFGSVDGWVHAGRFHPMTIGRSFVELSCSPAW
jgi:hypothetical protein